MKKILRNSSFRGLWGGGIGGRMRKTIIAMLFALVVVSGRTQTQALEQLQLNIEKLAQFKLMLTNMYNTYSILNNGYNNIKNISLDNFKLHKGFIDALSSISPAVKKSVAIAEILQTQALIAKEYRDTYNKVIAAKLFTPAEIRELENAYTNILSKTSRNLDALQKIITPNQLQMSEAERLDFLHSLSLDMEKQLLQLRTFTKQATTLVQFRNRSKKDGELLRNSYGIAK
jgi:hypothetical protein